MRRRRVLLILVLLTFGFLSPQVSRAQPTEAVCPAIVETALEQVDTLCADTGRNQACYGHVSLEVELRSDADGIRFEQPGDITDVIHLAALRLRGMDAAERVWGVALMQLQANLPGTLPGQNVTVLLFGDVQLTPAYLPVLLPATVTAADSVFVRAEPTEGGALLVEMPPDAELTANGRTGTGDWIRVALDLPSNPVGWLPADALAVAGDVAMLPVTGADDPVYAPMQAFYLQTGIGDSRCTEAPNSGILLHTPEGARRVDLTINAVNISVGSTVYLQSAPGDFLYVYVLEGEVRLTAFGEETVAPAGTRVLVPVDTDLRASGPPTLPEPYDPDALQGIPEGFLQYDVIIAEAANDGAIAEANACRVVANQTIALHAGPGAEYPATGVLSASSSLRARGVAADSEGATWWQVGRDTASNEWAAADGVTPIGACDAVPVVTDLPPVPDAPGPEENVTNVDPFWHLGECSTTIGATRVMFSTGSGGWESEADATANSPFVFTSIVIDGQPGPPYVPRGADGPLPEGHPGYPWQYVWTTEQIELAPGPHDLFFTRSERGWTATIACVYLALPGGG